MGLVSVITVTYESAAVFPAFLEGLKLADETDFELIVVDSGSSPDDRDSVRRMTEAAGGRFVSVGINVGYGVGSNVGASRARGRWLAFVNPDVSVPVADLSRLAHMAETHQLACAGPSIAAPGGEPAARALPLIRPFWKRRATQAPAVDSDVMPTQSMSGCCMVVEAETFRRLEGFDPRFFMFAEEIDLHARIAATGGTLGIVPSVTAVTVGAASSAGVTTQWGAAQRAVSYILYSRKHFGRVAGLGALLFRLLEICVEPRYKPRRRSFSQLLAELRKAREPRGALATLPIVDEF